MKIIFDSKTLLRKMQPKLMVFPEILTEAKKKITDQISHEIFDFFGMTVAEFLRLKENILPEKVNKFLKRRKTTFFDYIRLLNAFDMGAKAFQQILEDTTIQNDADEEMARVGLVDLTTEEAMLTFLKDYFNLQNLEKAQELTIYEYIVARKVTFNAAKFQKNIIKIQKSKIK